MTLKDVRVGQTVKVTKIIGTGPVKRRIMDMGITKASCCWTDYVPYTFLSWRTPLHQCHILCSQQLLPTQAI